MSAELRQVAAPGAPALRWKPYPAYKDSGVEWMGKVPEHWEVWKIKHSTYVKGRIGWKGLNSNDFLDEGAYLVTGTDFVDGKVNWNTCYHVSYERFDEDPYIQLKEKDILITKDGTIGKIAVAENLPDKATLNSGIFVIRPLTTNYLNDFMYWVLNSEVFLSFIDYTKTGSTVQHLYQNVFEDFSFPVPLLPEQRAIARFLDDRTRKIDSLIEKKQKLIELLKEERAAVINQAITKGLDPGAPMRDSGVEWLGMIPEHWEMKRVKHVSSVFVPQRNKPVLNSGNGLPWITMDDITSTSVSKSLSGYYVSELDALKAGSKTLPQGSVITSCVGNFGLASINATPVIINQQLQAYIPSRINIWFLRYLICISKTYFEKVATVTTLIYVNRERFGDMPIILPSPNEQEAIVYFLNRETERIDCAISRIEKEIILLQEYRTALISEAITGKIDMRGE